MYLITINLIYMYFAPKCVKFWMDEINETQFSDPMNIDLPVFLFVFFG